MSDPVRTLLLDGDAKMLQALSAQCPGGVIVNIGAYRGGSCMIMAEANSNVTVLAVDNFVGVGVDTVHGEPLKAAFVENVSCYNNIVGLHCDSATAAKIVCTPVSAVFVDGDHEYEAVLADLEAWWPKIIPGGVMSGHDYVDTTGVPRAVQEFCRLHQLHVDVVPEIGDMKTNGFFFIKKGCDGSC